MLLFQKLWTSFIKEQNFYSFLFMQGITFTNYEIHNYFPHNCPAVDVLFNLKHFYPNSFYWIIHQHDFNMIELLWALLWFYNALVLSYYYLHCANTDLCTSLEFPTFCTERKGNVVKFIYYIIVYWEIV